MRNTSRRYMIDLTAADRVRLAHVRNGAAETDDGYLLLSLVRNFFARSGVFQAIFERQAIMFRQQMYL